MTTTSRDPLICECGHTGSLKLRENDAPFSALWEAYSLEGFDGESYIVTADNPHPPDLLKALSPKCPKCGQAGKVRFA